MSKQPIIAIVGASFAGLRAYITLKKKFPRATFYLFDKEECFTYIPNFHILLCEPDKLSSSQIPLKEYFKEAFIHDEVKSISKNYVTTKKKTYRFDYLILSTGAQVNYFGNTELERYAYGAKSLSQLKILWDKLPEAKKIVIVGGGLSGVEYASVLATKTDKEIILINSGDLLLPNLSIGGRKYAQRYLEKKGVTIYNNAKAIHATKNSVTLDTKKVISADIIIQCTGLKQVSPLLDTMCKDGKETREVTNNLHLRNHDAIFLCGDVVHTSLVPTAHSAMIEGDIVAQHIIARIQGREIPVREVKKETTLAVALGPYDGFLQFKSFFIPTIFTGFIKWWIEKSILISYKYRIKLLV